MVSGLNTSGMVLDQLPLLSSTTTSGWEALGRRRGRSASIRVAEDLRILGSSEESTRSIRMKGNAFDFDITNQRRRGESICRFDGLPSIVWSQSMTRPSEAALKLSISASF